MSLHNPDLDENSDPSNRSVNNLDSRASQQGLRTERDSKPLSLSNEETPEPIVTTKKPGRLSYRELRQKKMFQKSGMTAGSIFKYFSKKEPEEVQETTADVGSNNNNEDNNNGNQAERTIYTVNNDLGNDGADSDSQDSDIICLGSFPHSTVNENVEVIDVPNSPEPPPVELEGSLNENDRVESIDESPSEIQRTPSSVLGSDSDSGGEAPCIQERCGTPQGPATNQLNDWSDSDTDLYTTPPMSLHERINHWKMNDENHFVNNKRHLDEDEQLEVGELVPSPSKLSRLEEFNGVSLLRRREETPERSICYSSASSAPPCKIVSVRGGAVENNVNMTDCSPGPSRAMFADSVERVKKAVMTYKEKDNPSVGSLISKKKWTQAIKEMKDDFTKDQLPAQLYVSKVIRNAIRLENRRVSKEVQRECMAFMELMIDEYSAPGDKGNDTFIRYYSGIFEQVFEETSESESPPLRYFFEEIIRRAAHEVNESDQNYLWLLNLVTKLVSNQYEDYEKHSQKVKVKPPLFQYFLESKFGNFKYDCCRDVVSKLFQSYNSYNTTDEFCIYLKWINLIAKRLSFKLHGTEYAKLLEDVVNRCVDLDDFGIQFFLNCGYRKFSVEVCWRIINKLLDVVTYSNDDENQNRSKEDIVSEDEKRLYFEHLANSLLIKPAMYVLRDLKEHTCKIDESFLKFFRPVLDCKVDTRNLPIDVNSRRNRFGETPLHKLCHQEVVDQKDLKEHLAAFPHDINVPDYYGNTVLHDCCEKSRGDVIIKLMELFHTNKMQEESIDFLIRNCSRETPMHLAACHKDKSVVEILTYFANDCGVKDEALLTVNAEGKLPFDLATDPEVRRVLKPPEYNEDQLILFNDLVLATESKYKLMAGPSSFAIKKILAWWSQSC